MKAPSPYQRAAEEVLQEVARRFAPVAHDQLSALLKRLYPDPVLLDAIMPVLIDHLLKAIEAKRRTALRLRRPWLGFVVPVPPPADLAVPLPEQVRRLRAVACDQRTVHNGEAVQERLAPQADAIHAAQLKALAATTPSRKLFWLQQMVEPLAEAVAEVAACRPGCDACCHQPVMLALDEARQIATQTGARLVLPEPNAPAPAPGTPCPFLQNHRCAIYAARPFACRIHYTLDVDATLCEGVGTEPPHLVDATVYERIYLFTHGVADEQGALADVRQFFPAGLGAPLPTPAPTTKGPE